MNISKQPQAATEASVRLSTDLQRLVDEHTLENVSWALEQIRRERSDAALFPKLQELLAALPSALRIHVFYDGDKVSYFRIHVEERKGTKDRRKRRKLCSALENLWRKEFFRPTGDMLDFVSKPNFEMHRAQIGATPVVIEKK